LLPGSVIRVLNLAGVRQSRRHYRWLSAAVAEHKPDVVAMVGDFIGPQVLTSHPYCPTLDEVAEQLSALRAGHLLFVRANHKEEEWRRLTAAWPFEKRPLVAPCAAACTIGPLAIVGFPCQLDWEGPWCETLSRRGNEIVPDPSQPGRNRPPLKPNLWPLALLQATGPAGRTLWLMHEPPFAEPIAAAVCRNPRWAHVVKRCRPLVATSAHDHHTPLESGIWHARLGETL
jgi:hypothetical protein